jgi:phosphomannomutase
MYRTGLLAALRSKAKGSQVIGVMITASHNPAEVQPWIKNNFRTMVSN